MGREEDRCANGIWFYNLPRLRQGDGRVYCPGKQVDDGGLLVECSDCKWLEGFTIFITANMETGRRHIRGS